jgi:hypothetical protein
MVVSDIDKSVFFHIPKNGGSTLRAHFLKVWAEAREYKGRRFVEPANRILDLTHLSPSEAKLFFNERPCTLGYSVYLIAREPMSRFQSALLQYIQSFHPEIPLYADTRELAKFLKKINIEELCERSQEDYACVYFRCQSDYVGESAYTAVALEFVNAYFSIANDEKKNPGGSLPKWLSVISQLPVARSLGSRLPNLKDRVKLLMMQKNLDIGEMIETVVDENAVFLRDFYADDFKFYEGSCKKC